MSTLKHEGNIEVTNGIITIDGVPIGGGSSNLLDSRYFTLVKATDDASDNGQNLFDALENAKQLNYISNDNRYTILVEPGEYDTSLSLDASFINIMPFYINNESVKKTVLLENADFQLGPSFGDNIDTPILISGNINVSIDDITIIGIKAERIEVVNFDINDGRIVFVNCVTASSFNNGNFGGNGVYINCATNTPSFSGDFVGNGIYYNCFSASPGSFQEFGTSTGYYENCYSQESSFGSSSSIGKYINCKAGDDSFGGNGISMGEYYNCNAINGSFGGNSLGKYVNCVAGNNSFGTNIVSGYYENCRGVDDCWSGSSNITATIINCSGIRYCFGGNGNFIIPPTSNTIIRNCTAFGDSYFFTAENTTIQNCKVLDGGINSGSCFLFGFFDSSKIENCINEFAGFSFDGVQNSEINNCRSKGEGDFNFVELVRSTVYNCRSIFDDNPATFSFYAGVVSSSNFINCIGGISSFNSEQIEGGNGIPTRYINCKAGEDSFNGKLWNNSNLVSLFTVFDSTTKYACIYDGCIGGENSFSAPLSSDENFKKVAFNNCRISTQFPSDLDEYPNITNSIYYDDNIMTNGKEIGFRTFDKNLSDVAGRISYWDNTGSVINLTANTPEQIFLPWTNAVEINLQNDITGSKIYPLLYGLYNVFGQLTFEGEGNKTYELQLRKNEEVICTCNPVTQIFQNRKLSLTSMDIAYFGDGDDLSLWLVCDDDSSVTVFRGKLILKR